MTDKTTLPTRFQISIPESVRKAHNWKPGQEFTFIPKGAGVPLVPVPDVGDLAGVAKGASPTDYRDRDDRY